MVQHHYEIVKQIDNSKMHQDGEEALEAFMPDGIFDCLCLLISILSIVINDIL